MSSQDSGSRRAIKASLMAKFGSHHETRRKQRRMGAVAAVSGAALLVVVGLMMRAGVGTPDVVPEARLTEIVAGPAAPAARATCRIEMVTNDAGIVGRLAVRGESTTRVIGDIELTGLLKAQCGPVGLIRIDTGTKVLAACDDIPLDARFRVR